MAEKIFAIILICIGIIALIAAVFVGYYTFVNLPDNHQNADCLTAGFVLLLAIGIILIGFGIVIIHDENETHGAGREP